jgi:hypothetical protein
MRVVDDHATWEIRALSMAADGDRGHMKYQKKLFAFSFCRLGQILDDICNCIVCSGNPTFLIWGIADLLYALKCQRCRLRKKVFLIPWQTFDWVIMNSKLKLRDALPDMKGKSKMNDAFAIRLFQ